MEITFQVLKIADFNRYAHNQVVIDIFSMELSKRNISDFLFNSIGFNRLVLHIWHNDDDDDSSSML